MGRGPSFWLDSWLEEAPLISQASLVPSSEILQHGVNGYWAVGRGWHWDILVNFLLAIPLLKQAERNVDLTLDMHDSVGWLN